MVNITLSIPEKLKNTMKQFPEVNWSGLVRVSIENKVDQLTWKQRMLEKLDKEKEFDKMALEIGDKVKEGVWKRLKKEGW